MPLPYHFGDESKSRNPRAYPITVAEFLAWLEHFLEVNEIRRFGMFGYSMGARLTLSIAISMWQRVDQLVLYAPDGFHTSIWNRLAVSTTLGHWVFKKVMLGDSLERITQFAKRSKIISKSKADIVGKSIQNRAKRQLVYNTWTGLREVRADLNQFTEAIGQGQIPFEIHIGRYDPVIPFETLDRWSREHSDIVTQYAYEKGHNLLARN